jgi:hypothetical protein
VWEFEDCFSSQICGLFSADLRQKTVRPRLLMNRPRQGGESAQGATGLRKFSPGIAPQQGKVNTCLELQLTAISGWFCPGPELTVMIGLRSLPSSVRSATEVSTISSGSEAENSP